MGVIRAAIGDAGITFLWVMSVSAMGAATSITTKYLGLSGDLATLGVTVVLLSVLLTLFQIISDIFGGASYNPTATAAFYAAGIVPDSLVSMAVRFPAQAAGAAAGALAITELMPANYKHTLAGPALKVDVHTGAVAEGVLTFAITFAILWILVKGPSNPLVKVSMLSLSTIVLIIAGASFTGPSMNPANAFGWAYLNKQHATWEQFYVYWACPFVGAILAAWIFRAMFLQQVPKAKKA